MQGTGFLPRPRAALISLALLGHIVNSLPFLRGGSKQGTPRAQEAPVPFTASEAGGREALQGCEYQKGASPRQEKF